MTFQRPAVANKAQPDHDITDDEPATTTTPPWETFSHEYAGAQIGMYVIKFPYTDDTYLLVTGISFGGSHTYSGGTIRERLQTHHTAHGVAGQFVTVEGTMRDCLKRFEYMTKMHYRDKRPDSGVNGTETYLLPNNEAADQMTNTILCWGKILKKTGNLRIPASCSEPNGDMISIDPEDTEYYMLNRRAMHETRTFGTRYGGMYKKREDALMGK